MNVFLRLSDGSFDTKIVYSTGPGSAPNSIAVGDFNRDGRMDIVVANEGTDNVAVFLAHDYVMFTNHLIYIPDILPRPVDIARGDFNNDGRLDIVIANIDADLVDIYLGYGNGTFFRQSAQYTGPKTKPSSLAVGDFNNDNYVVVGNSNSSSIYVFLGFGNGSLKSAIKYSTGMSAEPYSVAIGDFNNDSQLDIVVANYDSNNIFIFFGYGNGSFTGQIVYTMPTGSGPKWITVSDLDNDTFLDLVVANFDASGRFFVKKRIC
jgi:predicted nucleotidyltransferase